MVRDMESRFFSKEEGERLKNDVKDLSAKAAVVERRSSNNEEEIEKLKQLLSNLSNDMQKGLKDVNGAIQSKVDCEVFDDELALLKQMMPVA